ncbi:MAG: hypothetical protein MI784_00530, partial [Cytophagales bacterium]|nr:hypothetical protein [Cytophagales bacterium]
FGVDDPLYIEALPFNFPLEPYWGKGIYHFHKWESQMKKFLTEDKHTKQALSKNKAYKNPLFFQVLTIFKPRKVYNFLEKYVRPKKKMFIGGVSKEHAEKLYGKIDYYVPTPLKHAFEQIDEWWPKIEENAHKAEVIIPSVGSSSNIIAKRLWDMNVETHLLDIGSIIDAVEGRSSRIWIRLKGHAIQKVILPEYRDKSPKKRFVYFLKDIKFFFRNQIV